MYHNLHQNIPPSPEMALFPINELPDIIDTSPVTT